MSVSDGLSETGGGGSTGCFLAGMMQSFCGMYRKPKCCDCNGCHICTIVHQAVIHSLQRFNKFTSPKTHNSQTLELIIKASFWKQLGPIRAPHRLSNKNQFDGTMQKANLSALTGGRIHPPVTALEDVLECRDLPLQCVAQPFFPARDALGG